ncbi:MAG: hypothetical protein HQL59_05275 [Magnetococcales bacterium]|nr:hypothetical protein [Magnetococcales bacterium]
MANQTIQVAVVRETLHTPVSQEGINVSIREERLTFAAPPGENDILAPVLEEKLGVLLREERLAFQFSQPAGAATSPAPIRLEGVVPGATVVVDRTAAYRAVKWLLLVADEANGLIVSSEINCLRKNHEVRFVEFALLGDTGLLRYDLDATEDGDAMQLTLTSRHDGPLTIKAVRIGLFD